MEKRQANDERGGGRAGARTDEHSGARSGARIGARSERGAQRPEGAPDEPDEPGRRDRRRRLVAVAVAAVIALLVGISATALWQRDRARARLAECHTAAAPLLAWLEQAVEPSGRDEREDWSDDAAAPRGQARRDQDLGLDDELRRDEELPLSAAARLAGAAGGARGEAQAQGLALRAMLPAERTLVAEVHRATERLARLDDARSWTTVMRAYRWLAREAARRGDAAAQRGFLDRAVELGERCMSEAPGARAASGLAAALAALAELERGAGALEQSEQQWRLALQVLERQLAEEPRREGRAALRLQMSRALLALGDLEQERRRRAGARGYYERALASAGAAAAEQPTLASRRQLLAAGLRRLTPALVEDEDEDALTLCGQLIEQLAAWRAEVAAIPEELYRLLAALLDRCPRLPRGSAAGRWLLERLSPPPAAIPASMAAPDAPPPPAAAAPSLRQRLRAALAAPTD